MAQKIIPLIMCGGAGTRLWAASREVCPKQFLPLFGARSTFQDTLVRVSDANLFDHPIVITKCGLSLHGAVTACCRPKFCGRHARVLCRADLVGK